MSPALSINRKSSDVRKGGVSLKIIKILLIIGISALIIRGLWLLIYNSYDLKMFYYRLLEPVMKH